MNLTYTMNDHEGDKYRSMYVSDLKKTAFVGKGCLITVCMLNSSHKCWRGPGKSFRSFEDAKQAYKSGFMQAAIALAEENL